MENIIIGLICVITANVLLKLSLAKLKDEVSMKSLKNIIFKILCAFVSAGLIYYCGILNPQILVINMGGKDLNLIEALQMIFIAAIMFYGYSGINSLKEILCLDNGEFCLDQKLKEVLTGEGAELGVETKESDGNLIDKIYEEEVYVLENNIDFEDESEVKG